MISNQTTSNRKMMRNQTTTANIGKHWLGKKWTHWKAYPVSECWKDWCATIRCGLSGNEIYVQLGDIKELKTVRKDYVHLRDFHDLVRERLCLRKSVSLRLRFVGSRIYGRDWREHDVSFCSDDTVCVQYLEGAIFLAMFSNSAKQ